MVGICCGNSLIPNDSGNVSLADAQRHARCSMVKGIALAAFAVLALLTIAVGVAGFKNALPASAKVWTQNALWATVAGGVALSLLTIGVIASSCYKGKQVPVEGERG